MQELEKIYDYCKNFRMNVLKVTLDEMAEKCDDKAGNISAFENARANNIKYLFYYSNYDKSKTLDFFLSLPNIEFMLARSERVKDTLKECQRITQEIKKIREKLGAVRNG